MLVVAHRPSALAAVNMIAVIGNGKLSVFGPKDEVLANQTKSAVQPAQQVQHLPRSAA